VTLSVGINAADPLRIGEQIETLRAAGVSWLHVDVMDGRFCPPIAGSAALVGALPDGFVRDVHLMVDDPLAQVDAFVGAGADALTFHIEATRHPHRVLQSLAGRGCKRGVALNPGTPVTFVEPLLDDLELLLILAVNPGWPGQRLLPSTAARLAEARSLVGERDVLIGVDGGITQENVAALAARADVVVAGSAAFAGDDLAGSVQAMLAATA